MRRASILVIVCASAASSLAVAQSRGPTVDAPLPIAAASAPTESDGGGTKREKSGFGQVMSVLTGLLQEAAAKEVAGSSSAASGTLSSADSALTITVSPIAGQSTLFVGKPAGEAPGRVQRTPDKAAVAPARVAATK